MKTNHQRGFVAKFVKSGPYGTSKTNLNRNKERLILYNSSHHGFQKAKAGIKRATARLNRRKQRQIIFNGE